MLVSKPTIAYEDARGHITDLLVDTPVQHVAHFTCVHGSKRGNHYHKTATSYLFIIAGVFAIRHRRVGETRVYIDVARAGHVVRIDPLEVHVLEALDDGAFLMMTAGPDGGQQHLNDTVREVV